MRRLLCCLAVTGLCSPAQGQDAGAAWGGEAEIFFEPLPVVLSVSRLAQPLDHAPASVTVLDAAAIRNSGARDLADLLRMVPGFVAAHSNDGAPKAVYHGMTDENPRGLQIIVDGRSQYSPLYFGGVAWNLIDVSLGDIERIEVIRGSNSAAYGSNAFLGIVNILTRPAIDSLGVRVRVAEGSDGIADRYASAGVPLGPGFARVSAESTQDRGMRHFHDARSSQRVNVRGELALSSSDELFLHFGGVEMAVQAGTVGNPRDRLRDKRADKAYLSAGWRHAAGDGALLDVRYTRTQEHYSEEFVANDPALDALAARLGLPSPYAVQIDQQIATQRDEFELQHTLAPLDQLQVVWGGGVRADRVQAPQFYTTEGRVRQRVHRLFGSAEWRANEAWTLNAGATWENDSLSGTSLAPRLALNYHLTPWQTVRAGVSHAHRLPTLTEEKARSAYGRFDTAYLGRPLGVIPVEITRLTSGGLEQEFIRAAELAYLGDFRAHKLFVDVRLFHERIHDQIVPVTVALPPDDCELTGLLARGCGTAVDFVNGQDLSIRGLEYQLRWEPMPRAELTLNQTFTRIDARTDSLLLSRDAVAAAKARRHMEHSAPRVATMLRWRQRFASGLEASVTHYRYGHLHWTADSEVESYGRTDLRLAHPFTVGRSRAELSLTAQGIGGTREEYRSVALDPAVADAPQRIGQRVWLGLMLDL